MARILLILLTSSLALATVPGCASSKKKKKKKTKVDDAYLEEDDAADDGANHGMVQFTVKDADLQGEVLPIFEDQAGIRVQWDVKGSKKLSLRFTEPVPWEEAMNYVCRFTKTHLAKDYQGRWVIRNGWGGELDVPVRASGSSSSSSGSSGGSSSRSSNSKSSQPVVTKRREEGRKIGSYEQNKGTGRHGDAYGGGAAERVRRIAGGTTTYQSGSGK